MELQVSGVQLPLDAGLPNGEALIREAVAKALSISSKKIESVHMLRRSVDARKDVVRFVATMAVTLIPEIDDPLTYISPIKGITVKPYEPYAPLEIPEYALPQDEVRPVVVGTGPAGLFCALYLAKAGMRPLVLERGGAIEERTKAVDAFAQGDNLDLASNIQFGEGGAGTFSDGKLTTGIKGEFPQHILHWFVDAGAPNEILWQAKPHMGTDNLPNVVRNLRRAIQDAGGTVVFHARFTDVRIEQGKLVSIDVKTDSSQAAEELLEAAPYSNRDNSKPELIHVPCKQLVLACGHSARDTFQMLKSHNIDLEPKTFSVGVRIEHPQELINKAQYGKAAQHPALGAADYKMAVHLPNGRHVYTFCMCPGGTVAAAASEEFGVAVNGMSNFARDGENANAALLVEIRPEDFGDSDPLAGVRLQRQLEQAAYAEARDLGGTSWQAPAQTVGDYLADTAGNPSTTVTPSYPRGVVWTDLREIFPTYISDALAQALPLLDRKLKGFADPQAVMTGVETRSSSPVRIVRDDVTLQARIKPPTKRVRARDIARGHGGSAQTVQIIENIGIYPCGEGAGYAGGIMSAAADGLRIAQTIVQQALAVEALRAGKPIIFPTDTVYGLGVAVDFAEKPDELYRLKERSSSKPIAWLVASLEDAEKYGKNLSEEAKRIMKEEWPGAITIVVEASDAVPPAYRSQEGTIGLRMPDHPATLALIQEVGCPIATTSANVADAPSVSNATELDPALTGSVAVVLVQKEPLSGTPSAVIDCSSQTSRVLRPGADEE